MSLAEGTILKFAVKMLLADETIAENIFWSTVFDDIGSGPVDEEDTMDTIAEYAADMYDNILGSVNEDIETLPIDVWEVSPIDGDLTPIGSVAWLWGNNAIAEQLPNGVAAVIAMKTLNTEVTGRKFLAGMTEDTVVDNNWGSGIMLTMADWAIAWHTSYVGTSDVGIAPGVWSQTKLGFYLASGVVIINGIVGYQRRRKPGVGI